MNLDATLADFRPWWERATIEEIDEGLTQLRRARYYCRGRAKDLGPILETHIHNLELYRIERYYRGDSVSPAEN